MNDEIPDLWPVDLGESSEPSPIAILHAQASLLTKKTRGLVEGRVQKFSYEEDQYDEDPSRMRHSFDLVGPALGNYRVSIFAITTRLDQVYPVNITIFAKADQKNTELVASTLSEYTKSLASIFTSERMRTVVQSIQSHSASIAPHGAKSLTAEKLSEDVPF